MHGGTPIADVLDKLRDLPPEAEDRAVVAHPSDTITQAHELFARYDLHHLPVVEGVHVVGVVSSEDLLRFYSQSGHAGPETPLEAIMTHDPKTIRKDAPVRDAVAVLAQAQFRCLPVTNQTGEIFDVITTRDLVRLLQMLLE
jgi:CBS domain-containing protein